MRKYQPIWERIKKDSYASIAADSALHKRIVKAVTKEKSMDDGWKLLQLEKGKKFKLDVESSNSLLVFKLVDATPVLYTL